jgi:hypothetical protein
MPSVMLERTGGSMQLNLAGAEPEREYVVESSADMIRWLRQDNRVLYALLALAVIAAGLL